jgi:uncharacterized protein YjdB
LPTPVYYQAATKEVLLVPTGRTAPTTHTSIGSYTDTAGDNLVPYHYVQDLLYAVDVEDMGFVSIKDFIPVTGITTTPATLSVAVAATSPLTTVVAPATASNTRVTYASSDVTKATVNATTGVVTGVAAGSATITATSADGALTDTVAVTVTA